MKKKKLPLVLLFMLGSLGVINQKAPDKGSDSTVQTTGTIGSPSATTTIYGTVKQENTACNVNEKYFKVRIQLLKL